MNRLVVLSCVFTLMTISLVLADEIPERGNPAKNLQALERMPRPESGVAFGKLTGVVQTADGAPLSRGEVYFFNNKTGPSPEPEKYWRVPDMTGPLDDNGKFTVELPPGRYYIGAIQRKGDSLQIGPPADGDMFYAGKDMYEVTSAAETNPGVLKGAVPFVSDIVLTEKGITAIEGVILDVNGKPMESAIVFAHIKAEMNDKPIFVSKRTGKNGSYQLRVTGPATYYLRVRNIYGGGMPAAGAVMGALGGDKPIAVKVKAGEIVKGVNLTGIEFVKPARNESEQKAGSAGKRIP